MACAKGSVQLAQLYVSLLLLTVASCLSGCQTSTAKERFSVRQPQGDSENAIEQANAEKQQRRNLEQVNEELAARVKDLEGSLRQCQSALNTVENQTKAGLLSEVEGLRNTMGQMEQTMQQAELKARAQGMLAVWESLCIKLEPTRKEGWISNDYYLTTRVLVRTPNGSERELFFNMVKTEGEEKPLVKTFSSAIDALTLVTLFR
jgi:hypothetical protein